MTLLKWERSMEVDIPSIDDDHRNIVAWVNDLHEMGAYSFPHKTLVYVLDSLADYIEVHFRREERAMEACSYNGLDVHRHAHIGFESSINKFREQVLGNENSLVSEEVIKFILEWFIHHITGLDTLMANAIRGNTSALAATNEIPENKFSIPPTRSLSKNS
jgi:hemerythrin